MFNILGILLALIISSAARGQGELVGWESAAAVGVGVAAAFILNWLIASHVIDQHEMYRLRRAAAEARGLDQLRAEAEREKVSLMARLPAYRIAGDAAVLGLYAAIAYLFGWCDYVTTVLGVPMYLDLLPHLLPYFAMLGASWAGQYRIERRVRRGDWRPARFVGFQLRGNLMTILPITLVYAAYWALIEFVPVYQDLRESFFYLEVLAQLLLVAAISIFLPVVIRWVLPSERLPDGRLRRKLESFARDRGLRVNQLFVWRTGTQMFATAFVIGLLPPFRYVFITDALLKRMNDDEILAVFAHELGHVHHRHLWWLLAFIISFTVVLLGLMAGMSLVVTAQEFEYLALAVLILYAYVTFGYISRRFERQADAFAAQHTSPELISQVLLKLGMSSPAAMKKDGWRHFSLQRRVREIIEARSRPDKRRAFTRELRLGLAAAILVTGGAMALLVVPVRADVVRGLATYSVRDFDRARASDHTSGRLEALRRRALDRTAAMAELDKHYQYSALWYEGIIRGLSGEESDALDELASEVRKEMDTADGEEFDYWQRWLDRVDATRAAITRARSKGTSFSDEFDREVRKRGLEPTS